MAMKLQKDKQRPRLPSGYRAGMISIVPGTGWTEQMKAPFSVFTLWLFLP